MKSCTAIGEHGSDSVQGMMWENSDITIQALAVEMQALSFYDLGTHQFHPNHDISGSCCRQLKCVVKTVVFVHQRSDAKSARGN